VFVVFVHNDITQVTLVNNTQIYELPIYIEKIYTLLSGIIAYLANPMFFIISGFLLYSKETKFLTVLKKKSRSILLPYLIWNTLTILFFLFAQSFSFSKIYFTRPEYIIRQFGFIDWIKAYIGKFDGMHEPISYQFWFLRDLFIFNILFLCIKKLIDKFPFGMLILMFTLRFAPVNILINTGALFYFSLGYYIVKYKLSYKSIDRIKFSDIAVSYTIMVSIELFVRDYVSIIHTINIIIGCIFLIRLTFYFVHNEKLYSILSWLEKYAFFVYAIHEPLLNVIRKLSIKFMPMHDGYILIFYFGVPTFGIVLFLCTGYVINRFFPKVYAVLIGNR
jgi:fucose 4-O-acetylase-like acetyltransferase